MAERRQAVRREPIEVEIRGKVYTAKPLSWLNANDFGNEIVRQNSDAVNNAVKMYMANEIPQLDAMLQRKLEDWDKVLHMAYPGYERGEFGDYDADELFELGLAALDVNHLEYLRELINPNQSPPTETGGNEPSEAGGGQKTTSTDTSSSPELPETPSST